MMDPPHPSRTHGPRGRPANVSHKRALAARRSGVAGLIQTASFPRSAHDRRRASLGASHAVHHPRPPRPVHRAPRST
ncbi:unnamed protein product [Leptosia nina]|uniref:Uncharacterized protein n=1 Tax=Leptosia nina TaxID=320188 RepID=A0AAV1JK11_9NEOP